MLCAHTNLRMTTNLSSKMEGDQVGYKKNMSNLYGAHSCKLFPSRERPCPLYSIRSVKS